MELKYSTTVRGFSVINFRDVSGIECSIQHSSLATEDAIWIGPNDGKPQILQHGKGWQDVIIPGMIVHTRCQLTREQVEKILPILEYFVENGNLPNSE